MTGYVVLIVGDLPSDRFLFIFTNMGRICVTAVRSWTLICCNRGMNNRLCLHDRILEWERSRGHGDALDVQAGQPASPIRHLSQSIVGEARSLLSTYWHRSISQTQQPCVCCLGEPLPGTQTRSPLLLWHIPVALLSRGVPLRAPRCQQWQQQRHLAGAEDEQPQELLAGPDGDQHAAAVPPDLSRRGDPVDWQQRSTGHGVQTAVHPSATSKPDAGTVQGPATAPQGKHRFRSGG